MDRLTFNPETHEYRFDGEPVPSVTQIIDSAGLRGDAPRNWRPIHRDRGRAVHAATQYLDEGCLDEETVDPVVAPYLDGYRKFLSEHEVEWEEVERPRFCEPYRYAGTPDRYGRVGGEIFIVDIKTGGMYPSYTVQMAAYVGLVDPDIATLALGIQLDKRGGYRLHRIEIEEVEEGWAVFTAAVRLHYWKGEKL